MNLNDIDLKACPFRGNHNVYIHAVPNVDLDYVEHTVQCYDCWASSAPGTVEETTDRWNHRYTDGTVPLKSNYSLWTSHMQAIQEARAAWEYDSRFLKELLPFYIVRDALPVITSTLELDGEVVAALNIKMFGPVTCLDLRAVFSKDGIQPMTVKGKLSSINMDLEGTVPPPRSRIPP